MLDGYSFSIKDHNNNHISVKFIAKNQIKNLAADEPLLQQRYRDTTIYSDSHFAITPLSAINDSQPPLITPKVSADGMIYQTKPADLLYNKIADLATIQFTPAYLKLNMQYSSRHYMELLIGRLMHIPSPDAVAVEHTDVNVSIAVKTNNKLLLANAYPSSAFTDTIYYIMACYESLQIPHYTPLHIINAAIDNTTQLSGTLRQYLTTVVDITPSLWDSIPDDYRHSHNLNLFTLQTAMM